MKLKLSPTQIRVSMWCEGWDEPKAYDMDSVPIKGDLVVINEDGNDVLYIVESRAHIIYNGKSEQIKIVLVKDKW